MSQTELAGEVYTRPYISLIERDLQQPSLETLQVLASRLGKPVSYFLEELPSSKSDVFLCCNLAGGFIDQREFNNARSLLRRAANYALELGDAGMQGHVEMILCRLECSIRRFDEACKHGLKALKIFRQLGDVDGVAKATMYLGNVERNRGDFRKARVLTEQARKLLGGSANQRLLTLIHWNSGAIAGDRAL